MSSNNDHPQDSTSFSSLLGVNPPQCPNADCALSELTTKLEVDLTEARADCQSLTSSLTSANRKINALEIELAGLHSEVWQDKQSLSAIHWDVVMSQQPQQHGGTARLPARPPTATSMIDHTPTAVPTTQTDLAAAVQAFARIAAMNREGPATGYHAASAPAHDAVDDGDNPQAAATTEQTQIMPALENNTYASDREWINELLRKNIKLLGDKMSMQKEIDMLWGKVWKSEGKDKFGRDRGERKKERKEKKEKQEKKRQALSAKVVTSATGSVSGSDEGIDEEEIAQLLGLDKAAEAKTGATEDGDQDEQEKETKNEEKEKGNDMNEDEGGEKADRVAVAAKITTPSSARDPVAAAPAPPSPIAAALPTAPATAITTPAAGTTPSKDSTNDEEGEEGKKRPNFDKTTTSNDDEDKMNTDEKDKDEEKGQTKKRKHNGFRHRRGGRGPGRGGGSESEERRPSTTATTMAR